MAVDAERLLDDIAALGRIGGSPDRGVTRPAFSPADQQATKWLEEQMRGAGLTVRRDAAGNLIGRLGGPGPAIAIGSHIDTVPNGGVYDGAYGVLAGLACLRAVGEEHGGAPPAPLEVIAFSDEEGSFLDLLGSRAMSGALGPEDVRDAVNAAGRRLTDALEADADRVLEAARPAQDLRCYLELHVEQARTLERVGAAIGVVTGVAGIARAEHRLLGEANHAGAAAMEDRRDALRMAARLVETAYARIEREFPEARATFGTIQIAPNALNVVPGAAILRQEVRAAEQATAASVREMTAVLAREIAEELGGRAETVSLNDDQAIALDPDLAHVVEQAAASLGLAHQLMTSWASHDCQAIAARWPSALIFVPSRGGVSHHPDEYTAPTDLIAGVEVLYAVIGRELMR